MGSNGSDHSIIRILLVDDHQIFLAGLRTLLQNDPEFVVVGEARNRIEALNASHTQPDVILLDLDLGEECGSNLVQDLMKIAPKSRILLLTGVIDSGLHLLAISLGAVGIVHKLESPILLMKAIRKVHSGEAWVNRTMVATFMTQLQAPRRKADPIAAKIASLTSRELEVIGSLAQGRRNKEIAERLFISEKTVRHYLTSIFQKLEVSDRLELMIFSYQHCLATVPTSHEPPRSHPKPANDGHLKTGHR
jgi:two-component system nitrate/nitrite response regulator NarL